MIVCGAAFPAKNALYKEIYSGQNAAPYLSDKFIEERRIMPYRTLGGAPMVPNPIAGGHIPCERGQANFPAGIASGVSFFPDHIMRADTAARS